MSSGSVTVMISTTPSIMSRIVNMDMLMDVYRAAC